MIASGPENQQSSIDLAEGAVLRIGRAPKIGWAVPWDHKISREHADLQWMNGRLKVTCVESAANPILCSGLPQRKVIVGAGDAFRIGDTEFRLDLSDEKSGVSQDGRSMASGSPSADQAMIGLANTGDANAEVWVKRLLPIESGIEPAGKLTADDQIEEYRTPSTN